MGAIVELTFKGLRLIINPYQSREQRKRGCVLLKNAHCRGLSLIGGILLGIIVGPFFISIAPKNYIQVITRQTEIDFNHAEAGTIDTKAHKWDLKNASLSSEIDKKMNERLSNKLDLVYQ